MGEDPVKLVAVAERVLDQVCVPADPDVDALSRHEGSAERVGLEVAAFEVRAEASVALARLAWLDLISMEGDLLMIWVCRRNRGRVHGHAT